MGIFRLGFITIYLADPLISGFTTGAACHVLTSQIKYIFGIKVSRHNGAFKLVKVMQPASVCGLVPKLFVHRLQWFIISLTG